MGIKVVWLKSLREKNFRVKFVITIIVLLTVLTCLTNFLTYNETRNGLVINDPFLSLFRPIDFTWFIFILNYLALITALLTLAQNPPRLVTALHAYILMVLFRMLAMYSLPLNPPDDMILLQDPFVDLFGGGDIYVKDLFFSGHTATMFLLFLTAVDKKLKFTFLLFTFLVAGAVLAQHVHYTADVIVAPFVAYASYMIACRINNQN